MINEKLEKLGRENDVVRAIACAECREINPENPKAVAESIVAIYEALKETLKQAGTVGLPPSVWNQIDEALALADSKVR